MVPQLRTWGSPMRPAIAASAGMRARTTLEAATCACVHRAPIFRQCPWSVMSERPGTLRSETRSLAAAMSSFMRGNRLIPPASTLPSSALLRALRTPSTDDGA